MSIDGGNYMNCKSCGSENEVTNRFCVTCGVTLEGDTDASQDHT